MDILVDDEGRAYGTAPETEPFVWSLQAIRPLGAADVPTIEAPQLKVEEVVDLLKKIARAGRGRGV